MPSSPTSDRRCRLGRRWRHSASLFAVAILFAGCAAVEEAPDEQDVSSTEDRPAASAESEQASSPAAEAAEAAAAERRELAEARGLDLDDPLDAVLIDEPDSPLAVRRIHFAFDSSEIGDEFVPVVEAHGRHLADHSETNLTVEGHTDERGSREYNLALGERRAQAVARLLIANGANPNQLEVVSYGEEDPLVAESNEAAWGENRRAELLYRR